MGDRYPRWTYVVIFALLIVVVVLTARAVVRKKSDVVLEPAAEPSAKTPAAKGVADDKEQQIQELKNEITGLRKQTEASAKKARELESKLDETRKALSAAQLKIKVAQRRADQAAAAPPAARSAARSVDAPPPQAREKTAAKSATPASSAGRPAENGTYEIVRDTAVLEKPTVSAREVALIQPGTTVNVVGSQGEWLEIRSKHGKPPGYIRREDAVRRQAQGDVIK
jgi:hypothetical protein